MLGRGQTKEEDRCREKIVIGQCTQESRGSEPEAGV